MGTTDEVTSKAYLLAASVRAALKNGVRHYDASGRLLTNGVDVLKGLEAGTVTIDESDRKPVTTVEDELKTLMGERIP